MTVKERINRLRHGEVLAGYKKSEVGVIPAGWSVVSLGDLGNVSGGITKHSGRETHETKIPYLRVANVYPGRLNLDEVHKIGVKREEIDKYLLKDGDLLIVEGNGSLDNVGRVALWNNEIQNCIHQDHIIKVRFSKKSIGNFICYWLLSNAGREQIEVLAGTTSGLFTLSISKISSITIPLPPLPEQHRIAEILSTWDDALEKLDTLLEKKRELKRGLMQVLLSGKRRFPEFDSGEYKKTEPGMVPEEWEMKTIGDCAKDISIKNRNGDPLDVLSCTKYKGLVRSLDYFGRKVYSDDLTTYKIITKGQFAYATNHIEEGSLGYLDNLDRCVISPMYTVFEADDSVNHQFLFKLLKSDKYVEKYGKLMLGSINRRGGLRWESFSKINLLLPPLDREIDLLTQEKTQRQAQKKALMELLLTGKVRVTITDTEEHDAQA